MSRLEPADTAEPAIDINPEHGLIIGVADRLVPLFVGVGIDIPLARCMVLSAIDAYDPRTRADYVNIARTIAFSMSALALLGQAAAVDMPLGEKMRVFGRAAALNRSADQSERSMMQRRTRQLPPGRRTATAATKAPVTPPAASQAEPEPPLDDAAVEAAIADAIAAVLREAGAVGPFNHVDQPTAPDRQPEAAAPAPQHRRSDGHRTPAAAIMTPASAPSAAMPPPANSPPANSASENGQTRRTPHPLQYQHWVSGRGAGPPAGDPSVFPPSA